MRRGQGGDVVDSRTRRAGWCQGVRGRSTVFLNFHHRGVDTLKVSACSISSATSPSSMTLTISLSSVVKTSNFYRLFLLNCVNLKNVRSSSLKQILSVTDRTSCWGLLLCSDLPSFWPTLPQPWPCIHKLRLVVSWQKNDTSMPIRLKGLCNSSICAVHR